MSDKQMPRGGYGTTLAQVRESVEDLQEVRRPLSGGKRENTPTFAENDAIRSRCALRRHYTPITTGMGTFCSPLSEHTW